MRCLAAFEARFGATDDLFLLGFFGVTRFLAKIGLAWGSGRLASPWTRQSFQFQAPPSFCDDGDPEEADWDSRHSLPGLTPRST